MIKWLVCYYYFFFYVQTFICIEALCIAANLLHFIKIIINYYLLMEEYDTDKAILMKKKRRCTIGEYYGN